MDNFEISSDNYDPAELRRQASATPNTPAEPKPTAATPSATRPSAKQQASSAPKTNAKQPKAKTARAKSEKLKSDHSRWRLFGGVVLIVAALYMLTVSISYFANGAADQSIVDGNSYSHIADNAERIGNTGGPLGAYLSHLMVCRTLGLGSFIIIFYFAALGLSLLRVRRFKLWSLTYKCLLSAITLSVLAGFVTYSLTSYNYWGGIHGHEINAFIMQHAGIWGAIAVNIILVAAVVLVFLREIQIAIGMYRRRMEQRRQRLAAERAQAEERRRHMASMLTDTPDEPAEPEVKEPTTENTETGTDVTPPTAAAPLMQDIVAPDNTEPEQDAPSVTQSYPYDSQPSEDQEAISDSVQDMPSDVDTPAVDDMTESAIIANTDDIPADTPSIDQTPVLSDIPTTSAITDNTDQTPETPADSVDVTITIAKEIEEADHISTKSFDPTAELSRFRFPSIDLLTPYSQSTDHVDLAEQEENKARLTKTLETFGVKISKIEATIGPTITRYEIIPAEGVRTRSVKSLGEDLALALSALGIRIIAPIPGKGTIGIEVPNKKKQVVGIRNILSSEAYQNTDAELPIAIGTTITNEVYIADLAKLPHLLVAGATGMGKSVGLNTIIASLLYKKHPAELKFVLIDPKRVELSLYSKLERHYLASLPGEDSIIKDTDKVVTVLNSLCIEMERRLGLLEDAGVRNIKEYNDKFVARKLDPRTHRFLPYIVLIIDEFADIILTAGREVENPVSRLAAVARAAGIHLIIATQRPTVNVITGGIKTNIPGRIAFRVNQGNDSKTILDQVGANQLVTKGDMLFSQNGTIDRVQCAYIDTDEVKAIVDSIAAQIGYDQPYELPEFVPQGNENGALTGNIIGERDPLFPEAARMIVNSGRASTTELQRKLNIGFGRAGRIMDQLEAAGIVGPNQGSKPRAVLIDIVGLEHYFANNP